MKYIMTMLLLGLVANPLWAQTVKICDDVNEFPPYSYFPRVDGQVDNSQVTGLMADLFEEIFKIMEMDYVYEMIPWKRCLLEVDQFGERQNYEVFTNGSMNEDRAEKYWVTTPMYKTRQGAFYNKQKYPNGLELTQMEDLQKFNLCGVLGWGYQLLKLEDHMIDTESNTMGAAIRKVQNGRCDIVPNSLEPVYGYAALGAVDLNHIGVELIPNTPETTFHTYIAKTSPRGYELLTKINQAIVILQYRGVVDRLYRKYVPEEKGGP